MEAPRTRDDLIMPVLAIGAHQQRLDDAALAHGWQHIGHVRCLFSVAHVGPADGQLVLVDENECHGTTPCECRSVALSWVGGPVSGMAAKRAAQIGRASCRERACQYV